MDRLKAARAPFRATVTKSCNKIETELAKEEPDHEELQVLLNRLRDTKEKVAELDDRVRTQMLDDTVTEEDALSETDVIEDYATKIERAIVRVEKIIAPPARPPSPAPSSYSTAHNNPASKAYRLPKIEMPKFTGELKDWLGWWSQFSRIDQDDQLHTSDKFQYLKQAVTKGTEAADIIAEFPLTEDNYPKALQALKDRYGREDLLVQVYVRELLGLVINNNSNKNQIPLAKLHIQLKTHLRALESLNLAKADPETWLFPLVESSLPEESLRVWQRSSLSEQDGSKVDPPRSKLSYLLEFMEKEVKNEQQISLAKIGFSVQEPDKKKGRNFTKSIKNEEEISTAASLYAGTPEECIFCKKTNHQSGDCFKARRLSLDERKEKIKESRACYNCLKKGHSANKCRAPAQCRLCNKRHSTVICHGVERSWTKKAEEEKLTDGMGKMSMQDSPMSSAANSNNIRQDVVLLKTLHVKVKGANGEEREVRLLFDDGSQRSYIKTSLAEELKCQLLGKIAIQNCLFGGAVTEIKNRNRYKVLMRGADTNYGQSKKEIILVNEPVISGACPIVPRGPWINELAKKKIFISDTWADKAEVEILIGSDLWGSLMTGKMVKLKSGLIAVESIFGWTLSGEITSPIQESVACTVISMLSQEEKSLPEMWALETIGIRDSAEKINQEEHEQNLKKTFQEQIQRDEEGRYIVRLPWISESIELPDNKSIATKRLMAATSRLNKLHEYENYNKVFLEWKEEGIISEEVQESRREHFLPHRPVFKPESATTPVRPVFDASCRAGRGPSLNECMEKGPNLLELIPSILVRFREKRIGVISDIRKAFQMVKVHEEDQPYQKFLWWESRDGAIKEYRHCRVVFGMTCSPFILAAVLEHHLDKVEPEDKSIAEMLAKSLYVDNSLVSFTTEEEYQDFRRKSTAILADAKMDLRAWETNIMPQDSRVTSVLGMKWDKERDKLFCPLPKSLSNIQDVKITKRNVLSIAAQIFDPIGVTCPAVIQVKMMLQESWSFDLGWDEEWNEAQKRTFSLWYEEIQDLSAIRIPRHVFGEEGHERQIHCFVDASKKAYSAVVFLRVEGAEDVKVQLLTAKSRLAPLGKKSGAGVTINRLELLSCLIGSRLTHSILQALSHIKYKMPVYFWSDSTTALAWIERDENWGTFVGNRVREINKLTQGHEWRHVPGVMNPADLPSRGCSPTQLLESKWWEGPRWLREPKENWPSGRELPEEEQVSCERRKTIVLAALEVQEPRFSSYSKNVRVAALVRRFISNMKRSKANQELVLLPQVTIPEIKMGERDIIREIQLRHFPEEPKFNSLCVEKGSDGLFHVKTRLNYREDWEAFKSPILLPNQDVYVEQLILEVHKTFCHAGTQFVLNQLREKYWIIHGRKTVGRVLRKCVTCRRYSVKSLPCDPAPLPKDRIETQFAFQTTGVDLAGPIILKGGKKAWIVIYTCAVYRGVYLDWVDSLSTEEFLDSLEKFCCTVGRPTTMRSDNGTNFVGAANLMKMLNWEKLQHPLQVREMRWTFNPPSAPWWGGWWERLVRTVKDLLRKILGKAKLEEKGLTKCLASVSHVINNRPLTTMTEDAGDLVPLTPAMFMRDLPVSGFPERELMTGEDLEGCYRKIQTIKTKLKERFRKEYLALLIQKKNETKNKSVEIGDVVLVGADNKKRCEWPLGVILELYPGKDGKIRVAKVKTGTGTLVRPFQRLYPLEISRPKSSGIIPPKTTKKKTVIPTRDEIVEEESRVAATTRVGRVTKKPQRYGVWNK